jgi:DNA-binding FrmR family transcriptional regulator
MKRARPERRQAALSRVEEELLRGHVASCVEHAIASGDKARSAQEDYETDGSI